MTDQPVNVEIERDLLGAILEEVRVGQSRGTFASSHELYGVLQEEVDEFWDSVKQDRPDPNELLQVAAVAIRGLMERSSWKKPGSSALSIDRQTAMKPR